jgi:hypothetical protein
MLVGDDKQSIVSFAGARRDEWRLAVGEDVTRHSAVQQPRGPRRDATRFVPFVVLGAHVNAAPRSRRDRGTARIGAWVAEILSDA